MLYYCCFLFPMNVKHFCFILLVVLVMVLLTIINIDILKTMASNLWSYSLESAEEYCYLFEIIASVKYFIEEKVCFDCLLFYS